MTDRPSLPILAELHRQLVAKSCQLAELEMQLADYHAERDRLIHDLCQLQAQLCDVQEELHADPGCPSGGEALP
jgi:hypothetical protein